MNIINHIQQLEWHPSRRWSNRELSRVNKVILHQELGESSIEQVNRYHINPNHISSSGCPHFCYHYGISKNGEVIQANELSHVTWHTKGQNTAGIGIMFVGNFKGPGHELGNEGPTDEQMQSAEELVGFLLDTFKLNKQDVFGHYHFGKPACPGYKIQEWIEKFRNELSEELQEKKVEKSIKEVQKRLKKLGYPVGPVDGIMGVNTFTAIESFQKNQNLMVDGIVGPQTWSKLLTLTEK